jgi:hypothetical protein
MLSDPIKLAFPGVNRQFLEHKEKSGILGQGVWKFDVTGAIVSGHPEGEYRVYAVWLRLEGVGIKGRCIIKDVEVLEPVEIVEHECGAKPDGSPRRQIMINVVSIGCKALAGTVQLTVVP